MHRRGLLDDHADTAFGTPREIREVTHGRQDLRALSGGARQKHDAVAQRALAEGDRRE
jgi:hypothetical protein